MTVLLSKLRHCLGDRLRGRSEVELLLPPATFVDVEAALEGAPNPTLQAVHRRLLQSADS